MKPWEMSEGAFTAHAPRPYICEISGVQRSRMSKRALAQYNADRHARSEAHGRAVQSWRDAIIGAYDRGEIEPATPGLHPDAKRLIEQTRARRFTNAIRAAGDEAHGIFHAAQMSLPEAPVVGQSVRTIYGATGVVTRIFKKSVRMVEGDGQERTVAIGALGLPSAAAVDYMMRRLTDEQLSLIARYGADFGRDGKSHGYRSWQAEAQVEIGRRTAADA